ncbi:hypothetical protein WR25_25452 [Diploscapter pachys]|uniref:Serine/threonine-protein kinase PLK n=1 Tax=Diploscapter pachys TaxID=2018661 RepID=A0A2A2JNN8_9BILA|nr:hypothetical protein WR25_25452 [Diploscapter pachys]
MSRLLMECNYMKSNNHNPDVSINDLVGSDVEHHSFHPLPLPVLPMPMPVMLNHLHAPPIYHSPEIYWRPGNVIVSPARDEYFITKFLGKGGFAECYSVRTRPCERDFDFAMKIIDKTRVKDVSLSKIYREIRLHGHTDHPNIVKLYKSFEDERHFFLLMELCRDETLLCLINRSEGRGLPEVISAAYMREILSAVQYLLAKRILHRDLKPGNVFIGKNGGVRLGDFGLAIEMEQANPHSFSGTPNYLAPEILNKKGHSEKSEVWALGCTLFCMLTTKPPFETDHLENTYKRIRQNDYSFHKHPYISKTARNFIANCLEPDPILRPTVNQLFYHAWMVQYQNMSRTKSVNDIRHDHTDMPPGGHWSVPMGDMMDLPCLENVMGMQIGDEELPYERRITMAVMNGMNGESVQERAGWIPVAKTRQHRQRALRPKSSIDIRQAVNGYANERNPGGRGTPNNLLAGNPDTGSGRLFTARSQDSGFGSETDMSRMATMDHALHQILHDVNSFLNGKLVAEYGQPPHLFVSKWVDYSNRRGFSCKLLDGTVCVKFNEGSSLSYMKGSNYVTHVSSPFSTLHVKKLETLNNDQALLNQYKILLSYDEYMEKELATNGCGPLQRLDSDGASTATSSTTHSPHASLSPHQPGSSSPCPPNSASPYLIFHSLVSGKYLCMIFNDCTVQVNLMDCRKKVIFWREMVDSQDALLRATDQPEMIPLTAVSVIDNASNTSESFILMPLELFVTRKTMGRSRARVGERVKVNLMKPISEAVSAINPQTFSRKSIYTTEC